jgi:hypothetical protein
MTRFLLISTLLFACTKPLPVESQATAPVSIQSTGELRIAMAFDSKLVHVTGELVVAQDGTYTATFTERAGGTTKTRTGKLTPGELRDDAGKLHAKIDNDTVSVLHETDRRENGVLVNTTEMWMKLGTFDAEGTFTSIQSGAKISVGADGKLVGFPFEGMTFTVKAHTVEQKRTAIFLAMAMLAGGKTVIDGSGPVSTPAMPAQEIN